MLKKTLDRDICVNVMGLECPRKMPPSASNVNWKTQNLLFLLTCLLAFKLKAVSAVDLFA